MNIRTNEHGNRVDGVRVVDDTVCDVFVGKNATNASDSLSGNFTIKKSCGKHINIFRLYLRQILILTSLWSFVAFHSTIPLPLPLPGINNFIIKALHVTHYQHTQSYLVDYFIALTFKCFTAIDTTNGISTTTGQNTGQWICLTRKLWAK